MRDCKSPVKPSCRKAVTRPPKESVEDVPPQSIQPPPRRSRPPDVGNGVASSGTPIDEVRAAPHNVGAADFLPCPAHDAVTIVAPTALEIDRSVPANVTISTVEDWLRILVGPGDVVELRALGVDPGRRGYPHIRLGYYASDNLRDMARDALEVSEYAKGVYVTLNAVDPDLLARSNCQLKKANKGDGAKDANVSVRRWLLVDGDPERLAGISSTDAEKALAREAIMAVRAYLAGRGWPDPIVADSGNGYHLLYRIDLPADDGGVVKGCLEALAARFNTPGVKIDTGVYNPARITKCYGTLAAKGDPTATRPHRLSAILHAPEPIAIVPQNLLEALAAEAPSEAKVKPAAPTAGAATDATSVLDIARAHLAGMPTAIQGEDGSGKAFAAACALTVGFGLSVEQATPLFTEYSERCEPPWSEAEVAHKLADAAAKAAEEPDKVGYLLRAGKCKGKSGGGVEADPKLLIRLGTENATLFHTPEQKPYVAITVAGHRETHPLGSKAHKRWLTGRFYEHTERTPNPETFKGAIAVMEHLSFLGATEPVFIRTAEVADPADAQNRTYYLDLGNAAWQAIKITRSGWEVVDNPPVHFRRPGGMLPLPTPERGGSLDDLRRFVNVQDADWPLYRAALTSYALPRGPYPIIILSGDQGSAKTTTAMVTRLVVDPHVSPLRSPPRDERDLLIAASNSGVVGIDNISYLPDWLSDSLCRIATGGGMSTRSLYTDDEEVFFAVQRPIITNGIEDVALRADLLDRGLVLGLPPIPDDRRRTEADFWREFQDASPHLLGALLDTVVGAMAALPGVVLPGMPRMADFARWGEAVGRACGEAPGAFLDAYAANRAVAGEIALEASPVASALRTYMARRRQPWSGTATQLLEVLSNEVDAGTQRSAAWPKSPTKLGGLLRRVTPGLRGVGISVGV